MFSTGNPIALLLTTTCLGVVGCVRDPKPISDSGGDTASLQNSGSASSTVTTPTTGTTGTTSDLFGVTDHQGVDMVLLPGGTFTMGSPTT